MQLDLVCVAIQKKVTVFFISIERSSYLEQWPRSSNLVSLMKRWVLSQCSVTVTPASFRKFMIYMRILCSSHHILISVKHRTVNFRQLMKLKRSSVAIQKCLIFIPCRDIFHNEGRTQSYKYICLFFIWVIIAFC